MNPDFPCQCGHTRVDHQTHNKYCTAETNITVTNKTWVSARTGVMYCGCNGFIPDNLKYLEKKANAKP